MLSARDRTHPFRSRRWKIGAGLCLLITATLACALGAYLGGALLPPSRRLPSFHEVRQAHRPSEGWILDRHEEPLQEVRSDFGDRTLPWVPLAEVSPALVQAVLRSEDRRFYRHGGVDGIALLSAAAGAVRGRARGASTI